MRTPQQMDTSSLLSRTSDRHEENWYHIHPKTIYIPLYPQPKTQTVILHTVKTNTQIQIATEALSYSKREIKTYE